MGNFGTPRSQTIYTRLLAGKSFMIKVCTTCALALLLSFILVSTVPAAEQDSSKRDAKPAAIHPWAGFNPGSWVEIKSITVTKTRGKEETNEVGTKITLLEKTADKVVLENEMTVKGQTTKTRFDLSLKDYSDDWPEGLTVLKTGSETITIAGKSVTCDTMEAILDLGGDKFRFKRWTSGQVPGSLVKMVNLDKGGKGGTEIVDFKIY